MTLKNSPSSAPGTAGTRPVRIAGLRAQYHFRPSARGYFAWDVHRLIGLARDLPPFEIDPRGIAELDESYWFEGDNAHPTCNDLIVHMRLIAAVSFDHPIILCAQGRVMDGMHRVVRAVVDNRRTISAVRFDTTPAPDHVDVRPDDLEYD